MDYNQLNNMFYYIIFYAGMIYLYINLASKLKLIDVPSTRSSHSEITITGGGFVFPIAFILPLLITGEFIHYRATLTGLLIIMLVSFSDDLKSIHPLMHLLPGSVIIVLRGDGI